MLDWVLGGLADLLGWVLGGIFSAIWFVLAPLIAFALVIFIFLLIFGQGRLATQFVGWSVTTGGKATIVPLFKGLALLVKLAAEKIAFEVWDTPGRRRRTDDPDEVRLPREERDPCAEPEWAGTTEPSQAEAESSEESGPASYHGYWRVLGEDYEVVHVLCVGEPGSAKGQTILLPTLRHQLKHSEENIVFLTPKTKDKDLLRPYLREEDQVFEFSFCEDDPESEAINPLYNLKAVTNAASFLIPEQGGNSTHFDQGGQSIFIAGWETLREELEVDAPNLVQVYDLMNDPKRLKDLRKRYPRMNAVSETDEKFEAFRQTAQKALQQLSTEEVRRVFNATDDTRRMDLSGASGRTIVFASLDGSPSAVEKLKKFVSLFVEYIYQQSSYDGYYKDGPGTKIVIDEAGSCMQLTSMPQYINLSREYRVQILYVLQNMTQFEGQLGHTKAKECFISTKMKVIGAIDDKATAELVSERSGVERVTHRQPRQRNWQRHVAEERRNKLTPEHVYAQTEGEWIILKTPLVELVKVPEEFYFWRRTRGEYEGVNVAGPGLDGPDGEEEPEAEEPEDDDPSGQGKDGTQSVEEDEEGPESRAQPPEGSEPEGEIRKSQSGCEGSEKGSGEDEPDGSNEGEGAESAPQRPARPRLQDLDGYKEPPKRDSGHREKPKEAQPEENPEQQSKEPDTKPQAQPEPQAEPEAEQEGDRDSGNTVSEERVQCWNCDEKNPPGSSECRLCGKSLEGKKAG